MMQKLIVVYQNQHVEVMNIIALILVCALKFQHVTKISILTLPNNFVYTYLHALLANITTFILEYARIFPIVQVDIISIQPMDNAFYNQIALLINISIQRIWNAN